MKQHLPAFNFLTFPAIKGQFPKCDLNEIAKSPDGNDGFGRIVAALRRAWNDDLLKRKASSN